MEMPRPTHGHKKLEKLIGTWHGEERMSPSPWDPEGGIAVGRVENRAALGGFAVLQDYEQRRGGAVSFQGHGIFTYDAPAEAYVLHWFDSMGMPPNEFRGRFEGDVLTLACEAPHGHSRCIFDVSRKESYSFRMDVSPDGKQWQTFMEGRYTRER